jgi:hypothetical protein
MKSLSDADQAMHDPDMAVLTFAQMTPGKTLHNTSTNNPQSRKIIVDLVTRGVERFILPRMVIYCSVIRDS